MIYLDNAATTLKKPPCVAEAVVRAMATMGNSGRSAHQEALDASRVIYRTREQLARLLGCSAAERVVFTCNSTEALNIAIDGLFAPGDHVLSTDCEHNSVLRPLYRLEGVEVDFLPADRRGCIDYDDFRRLLRPNTRGIVCTHGSNLTGNLLDIRTIGRFAKEHGLLLVLAVMGGAAFTYFKFIKGKANHKNSSNPDDYDYEDGEELPDEEEIELEDEESGEPDADGGSAEEDDEDSVK